MASSLVRESLSKGRGTDSGADSAAVRRNVAGVDFSSLSQMPPYQHGHGAGS